MESPLRAAFLAALLGLAPDATAQEPPLAPGKVFEHVACTHEPSQSYALYLPSTYRPGLRWAVLYAFDPMARGRVAVELFRDAAERLGVVVVGSNNSRNGPLEPVLAAIEAVWRDTHARFALDAGRVYAAGMSGGTEAALLVGRSKGTGVIACAGPIEADRLPPLDPRLAWIGIAGDADFCFAPTKEVVDSLVSRGLTARFATFDGRHGWPPTEIAGRALELLELVAMRNGRRTNDEAFVGAWHEAGLARVRDLVARARHDEASDECSALARRSSGQLESAEIFFDVCCRVRPESASASYERARTLAARGDAKKALVELRRSLGLGLGLRDAARLREEPKWATLRESPDFQAVLAELAAGESATR